MSESKLRKYNIKELRELNTGLLICDISGDEWMLKGNILYHRNNRGKELEFHRQKEVKGFYHCLGYIKSHSTRLIKPKRQTRLEMLLATI